MISFLTLYKRLNFLIKIFHVIPDKNFKNKVKREFYDNFIKYTKDYYGNDLKLYKWETNLK